MKKIIALVLTFVFVFAMILPASAEGTTIKAYADAANGELLYTVNFAGDEVFEPKGVASTDKYFDYIVEEDGSLHIKSKEGCPESGATANWGAAIKQLEAGKKFTYTFTYKIKAVTSHKDNKIGVGAWINNKMVAAHINCYGTYNAPEITGEGEDAFQNSICLEVGSDKYNAYVNLADVGEYDNTDGFMTMMIVYDGPSDKVISYTLAKGADGSKAEDWLKVETAKMGLNQIADCMGFMVYSHYAVVEAYIKDAKIYKGTTVEFPEETKPVVTKKPVQTNAPATQAPATEAPVVDTAPVAAEGGCGASISAMGIALVAMLGTAATVVEKKRR